MCGLLTFLSAAGDASRHRAAVAGALGSLAHRGPDETGVVVVGEDVVLGFRRLSVIDLAGSSQPLSYADRYLLVFNGEIYNYVELREELVREHGATFATEGDAEVLAAAWHHWGEVALPRLRGMFAFVLWDRWERRAFGARDAFGVKPLYSLSTADGLYLASEKKALLPFAPAPARGDAGLDPAALAHYLTLQYVPEPLTMHRGVQRVEGGQSFTWTPDGGLVLRRWHRLDLRPTPTPRPEAVFARVRAALEESVALHLRSDVPVGAFLSGGIDSTAIVALARRHKPDLLTFTAGFDVDGYSEIDAAQASARALGVTTIPVTVTAQDMMEALPRIVWHLDDPVADPALVPLWFVAAEAARHVTVVLSGEGADELFAGYGIYREPHALRTVSSAPAPVQRGLRAVAAVVPHGVRGKSFLERGTTPLAERYYGGARIFAGAERTRLMRGAGAGVHHTDVTAEHYRAVTDLDEITQMQYVDLHTWLRGDILVKADRMSMAHSLELRVPFLDSGVLAAARTLPPELKVGPGGVTKLALRRALDGIVPPVVADRPKLGFPVPIRVWLRTEMLDWARGILVSSTAGHLLDLPYAQGLLEAHRRGTADHSRKIWTVLVYCVWHAVHVEGRPVEGGRPVPGAPAVPAPAVPAPAVPAPTFPHPTAPAACV